MKAYRYLSFIDCNLLQHETLTVQGGNIPLFET